MTRRVVTEMLGWGALGAAGLMMVAIAAGSWPGDTVRLGPGLPDAVTVTGSSVVTGVVFAGGLALTIAAWFGIVGATGRHSPADAASDGTAVSGRALLAIVVAVLGAWALPMLLSDPVLSRDAYSYVAQGAVSSRGLDPTEVGPSALGSGPLLEAVDPTWRDAPAPYGPVAIGLQEAVVEAADQAPDTSVALMRLLSIVGVVMTVVGVVIIARQHQISPALAVAAAVASPLVVIYLIGGSHNDAVMMGLLTLGMAALGAERRVLALAVVIAATAVKLPAAVGLVFIGWNWMGVRDVPVRSRIIGVAAVGAVALGSLAMLSRAVGIGFGWLTALSATGSNDSTFSLTTKIGLVVGELAGRVGLGVDPSVFVAGFRAVGLVCAAAVALVLLVNSDRIGVVRAVGITMVVAVVLGPVVFPWYLPAGLVLIAATGLGRWQPTYLVFVAAASALVWPASMNPGARPVGLVVYFAELAVIVAVAMLCVGAAGVGPNRTWRLWGGEVTDRRAVVGVGGDGDVSGASEP